MPSFSAKLSNGSLAKLKRQASEMGKTEVSMKKISVWLDGWVQRNFKSEGDKVGSWEKLKAGGRWKGKGKARRFDTNAQVLQDTGRLKSSFKPFSTKTNAGIGSELPYSKVHEKGLNGMKKRRMLPDKTDQDVYIFVNKIISRHIKKVFEK